VRISDRGMKACSTGRRTRVFVQLGEAPLQRFFPQPQGRTSLTVALWQIESRIFSAPNSLLKTILFNTLFGVT
jgi:hypothetical protein